MCVGSRVSSYIGFYFSVIDGDIWRLWSNYNSYYCFVPTLIELTSNVLTGCPLPYPAAPSLVALQ